MYYITVFQVLEQRINQKICMEKVRESNCF